MKLSKIAEGKLKKDVFLSDIRGYTEEIIQEIQASGGTFQQ